LYGGRNRTLKQGSPEKSNRILGEKASGACIKPITNKEKGNEEKRGGGGGGWCKTQDSTLKGGEKILTLKIKEGRKKKTLNQLLDWGENQDRPPFYIIRQRKNNYRKGIGRFPII